MTSSLTTRTVLAALLWITIALGVSGWAVSGLFEESAKRQFDARLEAQLDLLTAAIAQSQSDPAARMTNPDFFRVYSGSYWQASKNGQALFRSRSLWDAELPLMTEEDSSNGTDIVGPDDQALRLLSRSIQTTDGQAWLLSIAQSQDLLTQEISKFTRTLWTSAFLLALALLLAAVGILHTALWPLRQLRNAVLNRHVDRTQEIVGEFPSEIAPLVNDLNSLLEKNERLTRKGRIEAANLAHALKTPAAILSNEILKARRGEAIDTELSSQSVEKISAAADRHLSLVSPSPDDVAMSSTEDIVQTAEEVIRALQRVFPETEYVLKRKSSVLVRASRSDTMEVLGNLIENASKWARDTVLVRILEDQDVCRIFVEDDGSGVPTEARREILKQGVRLDEQRSGTGLGLTIVKDIVESHKGSLSLGESELGGLQVCVELPSGK